MTTPEMVQRILELSGDVPNRAKFKAHLQQLRPEILQHKLVILDVQSHLPTKPGNWRDRKKCFLDTRFFKEAHHG